MEIAETTTSMPTWLLFLITFFIGIGSEELGRWWMKRKLRKVPADKAVFGGSVVGAMLGLLAFMLGFTFSITASRFNDRRHLMIQQANNLGTCYLRTDFIPEKQKTETRQLFAQYMKMLVGVTTSANAGTILQKMEAIQTQLWRLAASLKDENMDPQLRALYVQSVNDVIDIFGERKTVVLTFRIPGPIWAVLLLLYLFNMFLVGLEVGAHRRSFTGVAILAAGFSLTVVLIAAMDASTKEGQFTVNRQPLIELQQMIEAENAKLFKTVPSYTSDINNINKN